MNPFQQFFNMKIGVVDLSASSTATVPLEADRIRNYMGGAAMNRFLAQQYDDDPVIFGIGPLTGSFAPASSLLVATFGSPLYEKICHVPFMLRTGPDMKFSGIDFLVVKGAASELSALHVDKGAVQILHAGDFRELPVPEVEKKLRRDFLPFHSAIVTGPAADCGAVHAAASVGTHGSLDKAGLASRMAEKNLKAIMFRGIGGMAFNADNPDQGKELFTRISCEKNFTHRGFGSVLEKIEGGKEAGKHLKKLRRKNIACYHCPVPCMAHVKFARRDASRGDGRKGNEGMLLLDHEGWIALVKKAGIHAPALLQNCLQRGLDPAGVTQILSDGETVDERLLDIEKMLPGEKTPEPAEDSAQIGSVSVRAHTLFGGGIAPIPPGNVWDQRVGLAMTLGICPLFLLLFPQISTMDLLTFIASKNDELKILEDHLSSSTHYLLSN